jgi:hypothetical protein
MRRAKVLPHPEQFSVQKGISPQRYANLTRQKCERRRAFEYAGLEIFSNQRGH